MIDFAIKNVYDKEAFELYSKKRDKSFRYVKYSGKNYQYLCDYIHEISPETEIWDEKKLKKGEYYTFSGRNRQQLNEIPLWELRCCIANNPYIVINGNTIPLALTQEEAEAYLKSFIYNRVTCYDNITSDYLMDSDGLKVINKDHPLGISSKELEKHEEWYIIGDDRLHFQGNTCTPVYEHETHTVHFEYDLRDKADRIMLLMHDINKMSYHQNNHVVVFNPSWEDFIRYSHLYRKCLSESSLKDFIYALYCFIFEETKGELANGKYEKARALLPDDFKYCRFVEEVGEVRNYYFGHGVPEYKTDKDFTFSDVFLAYINTNLPPSNPGEFEKMQLGMLNAFITYLVELKNYFASTRTFIGCIESDASGNVFVQDVLLPRELIDYTGYMCEISKTVPNNLVPLNYYYEFYCQFPNYISKKIDGEITIDENDNIVCNQILLNESFRPFLGMKIQIEKVMLTPKTIRDKGFLLTAKQGRIPIIPPKIGPITMKDGFPYLSQYKLSKKWLSCLTCTVELSHISFTQEYSRNLELITHQDTIITIKNGLIKQDSDNNYHCGGVLIPEGLGQKFLNKQVILGEIKPNKNNRSSYSFYCNDVITEEGIVEQDSNNNYHCGDVLIPWSLGQKYLNKLVKLGEIKTNTNTRAPYKYFCGDVVAVNGKS